MAVALSGTLPLVPAEATSPARPAELRFHLLLLTAAVATGALLQTYGPAWPQQIFSRVRLDSVAGWAALLLAVSVSIVVHELGHLVAALLLNYEVLGGSAGPVQVDWWNGRARLRFRARHWFSCSIAAVPREMPDAWRGRMMTVIAAGPVATLLFLLLAVNMALAWQEPGMISAFWNACAEVNFFLSILGLVPNSRLATVRNDAALFLALCKNGSDARDIFMGHQAVELSLRGIRPEDYPQALLLELANFAAQPYTRLMVARRMVEWAVDSGNIALASEWDRAALAAGTLCAARHTNVALAESACFDVLFREDPRAAASKFSNVTFDALFPPYLSERARAAQLLACGQPRQATQHILRAQYHLPLGNSYYHYERLLLDRLHSKALRLTIAAQTAA